MVRVILVQPGATDLDEQGRIKGSLDLPLASSGADQVQRTVEELGASRIDHVYCAPCQSAQQTAEVLAKGRRLRVKTMEGLRNWDHGLWHGKLIDEVRRQQPRVYRLGQEHPESVCPPEGESWGDARQRIAATLTRILRKHKDGVVALVIPEPLATLARTLLRQGEPADLWKSECDCGRWDLIDVPGPGLVSSL
jgi:broad specificity phosphatase PhoE